MVAIGKERRAKSMIAGELVAKSPPDESGAFIKTEAVQWKAPIDDAGIAIK